MPGLDLEAKFYGLGLGLEGSLQAVPLALALSDNLLSISYRQTHGK